jgi:carboxymethylenebutenolidase
MCHADTPSSLMSTAGLEIRVGAEAGSLLWFPAARGSAVVVVVPDYFGPAPFYRFVAERLNAAGFAVALVDLFADLPGVVPGDDAAALDRLRELGDETALRCLDSVVTWARRLSPERVGMVGFCAGGTWTMCLATRDDLAGVAFYGFPDGHPIGNRRRRPLTTLRDVRSPLLAQWGDLDDAVGTAVIQKFRSAAPPIVQTVIHPGVGHGFLGALAQEKNGRASVAVAAWQEALAFLRIHLTSRVTS